MQLERWAGVGTLSRSCSESLSHPPPQYLQSLCFHSNSLGVNHLQSAVFLKASLNCPSIIWYRAVPTHLVLRRCLGGVNSLIYTSLLQSLLYWMIFSFWTSRVTVSTSLKWLLAMHCSSKKSKLFSATSWFPNNWCFDSYYWIKSHLIPK